jgi:predicted PP-loop superfamily ATPase
MFAFPMALGAVIVGVVSLYRDRVALLSEFEIEQAATYTREVTPTAVRLALRSAAADIEPGNTRLAPTMRREVHQATGMLTVQLGVNATEAFLRLRAYAFSSGRSIHDVAHDVVERVLDFRDLPSDDGD